jgi:hypothetical protein
MPFPTFCRAFRCLLTESGDAANAQSIAIATNDTSSRECARQILQTAEVPEHRYRLGLSQILLQR